MTDDITQVEEENIDATTTEADEKVTGTDQTRTVKTFSQEEVNKIVAKEKAAWKRASEKAVGDHETIVESLRADITKRDELIQAQVDLLKKDLELTATEQMLLDKIVDDPMEQFNTLTQIIEAKGKTDAEFPRTPKGTKKEPEFTSSFKANV